MTIRYFKNEFDDAVVKADLYAGPDGWEERKDLGNGITTTRVVELGWMGIEITEEEFCMCKMLGYEEMESYTSRYDEYEEYRWWSDHYDYWVDWGEDDEG